MHTRKTKKLFNCIQLAEIEVLSVGIIFFSHFHANWRKTVQKAGFGKTTVFSSENWLMAKGWCKILKACELLVPFPCRSPSYGSVEALSLINLVNYFKSEIIAVAHFSTLVCSSLIRSGLKISYDFYFIVGCWVSAGGTYWRERWSATSEYLRLEKTVIQQVLNDWQGSHAPWKSFWKSLNFK